MRFICYIYLLVCIFSTEHLNTILANGDEENSDHYKTLGIEPTASFEEIRKAFKKNAGIWHPDKNGNNVYKANEHMKLINTAHDVLGNTEKRRDYDSQCQYNALTEMFNEFLEIPMSLLNLFSCRK